MDARSSLHLAIAGLVVSGAMLSGCARHERLNLLLDASTQQLVAEVATAEEAAEIIDMRFRGKPDPRLKDSDTWQSLDTSLRLEAGDCEDWAIASMALLSDDGWPKHLLIVGTVRVFIDTQKRLARKGYCHAVHLLERDGLYGANGVNRCDRFGPQFQTVEEVVRRLPLIQDRWDFYKIITLDDVDIVMGQGNLFDKVADRYKATKWIDIEYAKKKPAPRTAKGGDEGDLEGARRTE